MKSTFYKKLFLKTVITQFYNSLSVLPGYKHGLLRPCNVVLAKFCYKHTVILEALLSGLAVVADVFLNGCYYIVLVEMY